MRHSISRITHSIIHNFFLFSLSSSSSFLLLSYYYYDNLFGLLQNLDVKSILGLNIPICVHIRVLSLYLFQPRDLILFLVVDSISVSLISECFPSLSSGHFYLSTHLLQHSLINTFSSWLYVPVPATSSCCAILLLMSFFFSPLCVVFDVLSPSYRSSTQSCCMAILSKK